WLCLFVVICVVFFFQAEDGIRDWSVTGVQTCALPICFGHQASSRLGNDPDRDVAEGFIEGSRQRSAVNVEREHGIEIRGGEPARSEERRVGKEGRSGGGRERSKKQRTRRESEEERWWK